MYQLVARKAVNGEDTVLEESANPTECEGHKAFLEGYFAKIGYVLIVRWV